MCGILFCKEKEGLRERNIYNKALILMDHRGPDSSNIEFGKNYVIGHTRLAIIDLSSEANQPFWDDSRRFALILNGEIYNYKELKEDLIGKDYSFRTNSDTEVLLKYILCFGLDITLERVRGMFTFVFYDTLSGRLEAVRDHFGQKPLYYYEEDGAIAIASSIRALLVLKKKIEPNLDAYSIYLCTRGILTPEDTFFSGIKSLPAGHKLICNGQSNLVLEEYFNTWSLFDYATSLQYRKMGLNDALEKLEVLLRQAVVRHMVSDVPVGVLLSGGIDSTLIYWFLHETGIDLTTFTKLSPDIENIPINVVPNILAKKMSNSIFNLEKPEYYSKGMVDLIFSSGTPSQWPVGSPMYRLCQRARQNGVFVLLSGDGTDEYFAGYKEQTRAFKSFKGDLYQSYNVVGMRSDSPFYSPSSCDKYIQYNKSVRERILSHLKQIPNHSEKYMQASLLHDTSVFLQACNFPHSDAYSMMASVELRNPMLDMDLVKFVCNLPMKMKYAARKRRHNNKYLLRRLALKKIGAFVNVYKEGTRNYSKRISEKAYWDVNKFAIRDSLKIPVNLSNKDVFKLVNLEIWYRRFFNKDEDPLSKMLSSKGRATYQN